MFVNDFWSMKNLYQIWNHSSTSEFSMWSLTQSCNPYQPMWPSINLNHTHELEDSPRMTEKETLWKTSSCFHSQSWSLVPYFSLTIQKTWPPQSMSFIPCWCIQKALNACLKHSILFKVKLLVNSLVSSFFFSPKVLMEVNVPHSKVWTSIDQRKIYGLDSFLVGKNGVRLTF